jgi:hypothetical protein
MFFPNVTVFIFLFPANALAPTAVTLSFVPFTVIVSGTTAFLDVVFVLLYVTVFFFTSVTL